MLAYLFWHRPREGVTRDTYERHLLDFHGALGAAGVQSAALRLERLPFAPVNGYEDWYLAEDWAALGALGASATGAAHGARHAALAELSGEGWGGVYALVRGEPRPPPGVRWLEKARGESLESLLRRELAETVWRRQLVLGPAAELCLADAPSVGRERLWPG
jgi:hypothetical protein